MSPESVEFVFEIDLKARYLVLWFICFVLRPEKRTGKPRQFGGPPKNLYSRWSSMKTLIDNNLVSKTRCPAKYVFHLFFLAFIHMCKLLDYAALLYAIMVLQSFL